MKKSSAYLMSVLAFALGFGAGHMASKGCPPVPVPAAHPAPAPDVIDGPMKPAATAEATK